MEENKEVQVNEQPVQEQTNIENKPQEPEIETIKAYPTGENPEEEKPEKKKKSKKGLVILLLLLLLLILLIGCGAYYYFNVYKKDSKTIKNTNKQKYDYTMKGNSLENFDLKFMQLENNGKNTVYSPLSIKYALEMLSDGAKGETKTQIDNIIGKYKSKSYPNNKHMSFANAMFIRNSFKDSVKDDYINTLKQNYNAEVILDPFENPNNINKWVSDKTFKLINNLVDDTSDNNFFLINALAIDMNWKNRIQSATAELPEGMNQMYYSVNYIHEKYSDYIGSIEDDRYPKMEFNGTKNYKSVIVGASFNHYDIIKDKGEENVRNTVKADYEKYLKENPEQKEACPEVNEYLNQYIKEIKTNYKQEDISTDFYISDNENEKVFAKDLQTYDGISLQYVGIMPKKEALNTYIKNTNAEKLTEIINNMKEVKYDNFKDGVITKIKGNIPLFKYDYELQLQKDLQKLGVTNIFDINKSDLSNMISGKKQFIDKAIHKATIDFSNDGIKAAAATAVSGMGAAMACMYDYEFEVPVEEIDVSFNKPYIYIIRDKDTGEVWFTGSVYEPTKCTDKSCYEEVSED